MAMPIIKIAIDEGHSGAKWPSNLHFRLPLPATNPADILSLLRLTARTMTLCELRQRFARREETERLLLINSSFMVDLGLSLEDKLRRCLSD
jgi:hypothetical protein